MATAEKTMNDVLRFSLALLCALMVFVLVRGWLFSSYNAVHVELESGVGGGMQLFYAGELTPFSQKYSKGAELQAGKREHLRFLIGNNPVDKLRLDPGSVPGEYRLYSVRLVSFFVPEIRFKPGEVAVEHSPDATLAPQPDGSLVIHSSGSDPWVSFPDLPRRGAPVAVWVVPLLAALFAWIFLPEVVGWRPLFWRDTFDRRPSTGVNFNVLDGLRGFAALSVFLLHAGAPFCDDVGVMGVVIFFTLSGFLLALPFTRNSSLALSNSYMKGFYARRLRRIVPMFYLYVFIAYWFTGQVGDLVRSLLFLQGNSILWAVIQEVHFYLLVPAIVIVCHLLFRGRFLWTGFFLLGFSLYSEFGNLPHHTLYGDGSTQPLYLWTFTAGMAAAWFFKAPQLSLPAVRCVVGSNLTGVVLVVLLLWPPALYFLQYGSFSPVGHSWIYSSFFPLTTALLLLHLLAAPEKGVIKRVLSSAPLCLLGTISYSFYLLHPSAIKAGRVAAWQLLGAGAGSLPSLLLGLLFAVMLSAVTYSLVERPFMGRH